MSLEEHQQKVRPVPRWTHRHVEEVEIQDCVDRMTPVWVWKPLIRAWEMVQQLSHRDQVPGLVNATQTLASMVSPVRHQALACDEQIRLDRSGDILRRALLREEQDPYMSLVQALPFLPIQEALRE